jgi:hypothetical protein
MYSFFTNPWMLAAAVAVSLPIIIEWLFRRRKRQVELPTIRYLLRNKEQEKIKRQDRILLLLRMAGIGLLVLAITRPIIQHGLMGGARQRHVVVLLDGTASTSQQVGVTTSFGLAQKKAAAMIRELPKGTAVSVGLLGHRAEAVFEEEQDLHTAAGRVEALRAGSGAAPITDGLAWAAELLGRSKAGKPEVYIFSDFQKHTWVREGKITTEASRALGALADRSECFLVDTGGEPKFNYMLTELRPDDWLMSVGMPVRFRVQVELWGKPPEGQAAAVTFLVDGDKKDVREVRVGDRPATLEFEHRFAVPGEHLVEAVLEGDEHRVDNRRMYLCSVPENVQVLVLDDSMVTEAPGAPAEGGPAAGRAPAPGADRLDLRSSYLTRAIAPPSRPGAERVSRFAAKVINCSQIDFENLENYAAVVLTEARDLSEPTAVKLENYVSDGGALWVFMGPQVNVYQYNKLLFKDGNGLLPSRLKAGAAPPAGTEAPFIRFGESTHPALAQLTGSGNSDAKFLNYMDLEVKPDTRVVLALSNGAPAVLEKSFGRGRALLVNSTAGVDWSYLPATIEFPILVQEMMRYLVGNPDAAVNLNVGDRFEEPVYVSTQHLLLKLPDGRKERLTPRAREGRANAWTAVFEGTRQQGRYEFVDASPEALPRLRFVVNQKPEEGDLSRFTRGDFAEAFGHAGARWIGQETPVEDFVAKLHSVTELAPAVLWMLILVLAVESFLAARFGRRRGGASS